MAKDDERPQFNPKHRIAGAIILVSLAVIFVPMLLDESAAPVESQALSQIPDRDATDTKVVVTPVNPTSEPAATTTPEPPKPIADKPAPSPSTETAKPETKPAPVAAVDKPSDSPAKAKPAAAKSSDASEKISKGWIVQVGTFANTENAERLRDKLKNLGYAVNSESVTHQGSKAVRLRVGPYREKTAATKAQTQLQKELNIQGLVQAYP
jgi:DedD protein